MLFVVAVAGVGLLLWKGVEAIPVVLIAIGLGFWMRHEYRKGKGS